ncbi:hypothetical protein ACPXCG_03375 [Gordonia sp. DT218]|uniref:hypothetical protein n=1 Tax=Gordonia sp. DT218 TaxID=3416659 RepID=UPI003CF82A26
MRKPVATLSAGAFIFATAVACSNSTPDNCIDVPEATVTDIAHGGEPAPLTVTGSGAVQSPDSDLYYVALNVTTSTGEQTGVWLVNTLDDTSKTIVSADAMAAALTHWPQYKGQNFSGTPAHQDAIDCANQ